MAATKTFHYNSIDSSGRKTKGTVEAANESAASHLLRQRGEVPLELSPAGRGLNRELHIPGLANRVKLKDLAVFARQFATMTASGMSLLRSLAILEEQTSAPALKKAVGEIRADVAGGVSLSAAMAKHDKR
jgi:type IV pilus assembly protein PilC